MAKFDLTAIEQTANRGVLSRSRGYEKYTQIVGKEPGNITAKVRGSQLYQTSIRQKGNGHYTQECSCPYGAPCKHTMALARMIHQDINLRTYIEMNEQRKPQTDTKTPAMFKRQIWDIGTWDDEQWEEILHLEQTKKQKTIETRVDLIKLLSDNLQQKHAQDEKKDKGTRERRLAYTLSACKYEGWGKAPRMLLSCGMRRSERGKASQKWKYSEELYSDYYTSRDVAYLSDLDRRITAILRLPNSEQVSDYHHYRRTVLDKIVVEDMVKYLSLVPDLTWQDGKEEPRPLTIKLDHELKLEIVGVGKHYQIRPNIEIVTVFDYPHPLVLTKDQTLVLLSNKLDSTMLAQIIANPQLPLGIEHNKQAILTLLTASRLLPIKLPPQWLESIETGQPVPQITFSRDRGELYSYRIEFDYGGVSVNLLDGEDYAINHDKIVRRNHELEKIYVMGAVAALKRELITELENKVLIFGNEALFTYMRLLSKDWEIYLETEQKMKVNRSDAKLRTKVTSGIDWLEINGTATLGAKEYKLAQLVAASMEGERVIRLDGELHILPEKTLAKLKSLGHFYSKSEGVLRLARERIGLMDGLDELIEDKQIPQEWQKMLQVVRSFEGIEKAPLPRGLNACLRDYQHEGVSYLNYLKETRFGGILADDMGLGKTVQAITMLLLMCQTKKNMRALIVMPTSVIHNWQSELSRFAPSLKTYVFAGLKRDWGEAEKAKVVLTTYALLRREEKRLTGVAWDYVILDEAQYAKNVQSQAARVVYQLNASHRLALSGTPIENNLTELYAEMRFLNPGLFGNLEEFQQKIAIPIEKRQDKQASQHLKQLIKPFILRRTKEQVLWELPKKTEILQMLELNPKQQQLYEAVRAYYQTQILGLVESQGVEKSRLQILTALLRLRQACNDPRLVGLDPRKLTADMKEIMKSGVSTKLGELMRLVNEAVAEGHKVLVFSQFVEMIKLIEPELKNEKIKTWQLTGSTPAMKRKEIIQDFQQCEAAGVFLLSLKAGGTGVNLTAADYVIHFDPWWNPAVENQATDRAHRIGQTKPVSVYKLITKNTIEEKILLLQVRKKKLVDEILTGETVGKGLTKDDLEYLLG